MSGSESQISWSSHKSNITDMLLDLYMNTIYSDCKLIIEGKSLHVHKQVLAKASTFFATIFEEYPAFFEPTVIIPDFSYDVIQSLIYFIYTGEVIIINNEQLNELYEAGLALQIKSIKYVLDEEPFRIHQDLDEGEQVEEFLFEELPDDDQMTKESADALLDDDLIEEIVLPQPTQKVETKRKREPITKKPPPISKRPKIMPKIEAKLSPFFVKQEKPDRSQSVSLAELKQKALRFQKSLEVAIQDCKNGMKMDEACRKYGVPKDTLWRNIKNLKLVHIVYN